MVIGEAPVKVRVTGLTKSYGELKALAGVSFVVRQGEVLAYLGPNGAGKTTTINILCGLLDRDGGEVSICGVDVARDPVFVQSRIGVVPEGSNLYPELACRRNLEYLGELYGLARVARKERASELLDLFGLGEKAAAPFRTLSRGMKRRLTVAAALVHHPEIVFLDEPTVGLDVPSARALRALIQEINRDGTTVLLSTHNLSEAEALCDRVLILVKGRVVAEGTGAEIQQRVERARTVSVAFSGDASAESLRGACPSVRTAAHVDGKWRLEVDDLHTAVCDLVAFAQQRTLRILELDTAGVTLEEAFISILDDNVREPGVGS
jgi:ABC-2 type transport system ATP-binding protein